MPFLLLIIAISLVVLTWSFWRPVLEAGAWIALALLAVFAAIWLILTAFDALKRVSDALFGTLRRKRPRPRSYGPGATTPENWERRAADALRRAEEEGQAGPNN